VNNNYQNTPVLSSAAIGSGNVTVSGALTQAASPNTQYRIEFYLILAGGQKEYLGFATVTTNGSGVASISTTLTASVTAGQMVTATATDSLGNTSEFAAAVTAS
jgi:uncharacterized membrane protein YdcZ (DUF606 family)